jgi:hypothetical protein
MWYWGVRKRKEPGARIQESGGAGAYEREGLEERTGAPRTNGTHATNETNP